MDEEGEATVPPRFEIRKWHAVAMWSWYVGNKSPFFFFFFFFLLYLLFNNSTLPPSLTFFRDICAGEPFFTTHISSSIVLCCLFHCLILVYSTYLL